jgi:hypothetical protein
MIGESARLCPLCPQHTQVHRRSKDYLKSVTAYLSMNIYAWLQALAYLNAHLALPLADA